MLGFAQHTQMPCVALSLVCAPFLRVRWKQSVKRPLWIRKLHLLAKAFHANCSQTPARPTERCIVIAGSECRPATCYDSLVFWHPDSSQESWWEKHKSLCWRHSRPIGCNTLEERETRWDSWGRSMRLLQQGALVHENKHWPHTHQSVFQRCNRRPDLQGFTVCVTQMSTVKALNASVWIYYQWSEAHKRNGLVTFTPQIKRNVAYF